MNRIALWNAFVNAQLHIQGDPEVFALGMLRLEQLKRNPPFR